MLATVTAWSPSETCYGQKGSSTILTSTIELLERAQEGRYAVGAFNVYHLEGVNAVLGAAEVEHSPVILQILLSALEFGGTPLVALCLEGAQQASIPADVHLDHSTSEDIIRHALDAGISSIMADGSHLSYVENVAFTRRMVRLAHDRHAVVEAELGRISGTEDGLTVEDLAARMTDPDQATEFVAETGIDALAVCIGNVHGKYSGEPQLDFERLAAIRVRVSVPLVLHGASGLPESLIRHSIALGVSKFNVNTEVRSACVEAARTHFAQHTSTDLLDVMRATSDAMQAIVRKKVRLFGSAGQA